MLTNSPRFTIKKTALVALAKLVKAAKLQEVHIRNGQLLTTVPIGTTTPADAPRLVADLRNLLGGSLNLHVKANELLSRVRLLRSLPETAFRLEVGAGYLLHSGFDRYLLERLPNPQTVPAPLKLAGRLPLATIQIPPAVQRKLKGQRDGGQRSVELLLQAGEVYQLAVVDPAMAGRGEYRAILDLPSKPTPDMAAGPELVLRCQVFFPHWLADQYPGAVTSKVLRLPQEPQPYWLISSVILGRDTALFCEPLALVREQYRQRSEQELDACLAQLAA